MPRDRADLARAIESASADPEAQQPEVLRRLVEELKSGLNDGSIRAAEEENGRWVARPWVKKGILLGFRVGVVTRAAAGSVFPFFDKDTFPVQDLAIQSGVRIVPGGTSIRDGCHVGRGVTLMPPSFVNVGAFIGDGTMIDSHVLIGSCAQIGSRVHVSAGAQIGGVLEPVGELPVIIEDDVLVGGNCGVYEGAVVRRRAVLAAGVILTGGTPVYDVVRGEEYRRRPGQPLEIPAGAVVVPGSRAIREGRGAEWGLSLQTPVIVKYRDEKTDASVALEELLR